MLHFIYGLFINGSLFYIGMTCDKRGREATHKKRFGDDITFIVLYERRVNDKGCYGISMKIKRIESALIKIALDNGHPLANKHYLGYFHFTHTAIARKIYNSHFL